MKKNRLKIVLVLITFTLIIAGCVKEDFDTVPEYVVNYEANTSIAELKNMHAGSSLLIDTTIIIKGIVVSNDEFGNFYEELFIQDTSGAIAVRLNESDLYERYPVGKLVYIKCEGLYLDTYNDIHQLGYKSSVDKIPSVLIEDYVDISAGGTPVAPKLMTIGELNDNDLGTFIKIENVQFAAADTALTYAVIGDNYSERDIQECGGASVILSTSEYATFKDTKIPDGKGTIKAILSKYSGNYQLRIISPDDIVFDAERCAK